MTVHKSFTSTFLAFCKGEIQITAQDKFRFACASYHVFQTNPDLAPYEVAWQCGLELEYDSYEFLISNLPKERQKQWKEFLEIITEAHSLGNVVFCRDAATLKEDWLTKEELEDSYFMDRYNSYNNKGVYS